jgi:hypothetical protein
MGQEYPELSHACQHALALCKVYRSRFAFPGECKLHGPALHFEHVPALLADVPLLPEKHDWLDAPMKRIRQMPAISGSALHAP